MGVNARMGDEMAAVGEKKKKRKDEKRQRGKRK
jgi:hypothetical protein